MRQTLELALEWIEKQPEETPHSKYDVDTRYVVIRELEAALAQPERDYERGFIDGMQKQMQSSVDKAVNAMSRTWTGLTDEERLEIAKKTMLSGLDAFAKAIEAKLKEKNT